VCKGILNRLNRNMTILAKTDGTILTAASRWGFVHDVFRRKQGCQASFVCGPDMRIRFRPLPVNQPRHTPPARRIGDAMISRVVVACALALGVISPVFAGDCVRDNYGTLFCGRGNCLMDSNGKLHCAKRGGGVIRDEYGNVRCGVGYCTADDTGRLLCSTTLGGNITRDSYGKVTCEEGCREAQAQLCQDLP
jgi:hypothetical protein